MRTLGSPLVALLLQACEGIAEAHSLGIVTATSSRTTSFSRVPPAGARSEASVSRESLDHVLGQRLSRRQTTNLPRPDPRPYEASQGNRDEEEIQGDHSPRH